LKLNRKKKKSPLIPEEEFIGYEAFTSGYQDKLVKNKQDDSKFCRRS
jgi:hypothetical protein